MDALYVALKTIMYKKCTTKYVQQEIYGMNSTGRFWSTVEA
jgi:hypothetical protein